MAEDRCSTTHHTGCCYQSDVAGNGNEVPS